MTAFTAAFLFGSGALFGFALATFAFYLRPKVQPTLALVGSTAVNAQIPPQNTYPYEPFYPTPENEAALGRVGKDNSETHEPLEASRR